MNTDFTFISYAKEDLEIVKKLCYDLKKANINIWVDYVNLTVGDNFKIEIQKAIHNCRFFLVLLSQYYINKIGYVHNEIKLALEVLRSYPPDKKFIIPVRSEKCESNYFELKDIHYINLFENWDECITHLIRVLSSSDNQRSKEEFDKIKLEILAKKIYSLKEIIIYKAYFLNQYGSFHEEKPDERDNLDHFDKQYRRLMTKYQETYSTRYDPLKHYFEQVKNLK